MRSSGLILVSLLLVSAYCHTESNKLVYKLSKDYEKIWDDTGSGADVDVSLWKLKSLESGFYPLGDVAVTLHNEPTFYSILVKDMGDSIVRAPVGYTQIWTDAGSGASRDVAIYSIDGQIGYTCIGNVAVSSHSLPPNLNNYRCVNSDYLIQGQLSFIWNDRGSGASKDVSLWKVENDPMLSGIATFTFLSHASHDALVVTPSVLDETKSIPSSFLPIPSDVALIMYDTNDVDLIWNDHGSGGLYDISLWRPRGCCTLGDVAVNNYIQPTGILLREVIPGTLRKPLSFEQVWDDRGSGAKMDVSIWKPLCPVYFFPLGHVAVGTYGQQPSKESIRCVNTSLLAPGTWEWVYNDRNTGSYKDVSIWRPVAVDTEGQVALTFKAVARHGDMDENAYVLRSDVVSVQTGSPVAKVELVNFVYDFGREEVTSVNTLELTTKTVADNCKASPGSPPINVKRTLSVTTTYQSSWTTESTLSIGVELKFVTGIPLIAQNEVTMSTTFQQSWQKTVTDSKAVTDTLEASIDVNPGKTVSFGVTGERYIGNVPWTATMITTFEDGGTNESEVSGMFTGIQVSEIRVSADAPQDCT